MTAGGMVATLGTPANANHEENFNVLMRHMLPIPTNGNLP